MTIKMQKFDYVILGLIKKGYRTSSIVNELNTTECRVKLIRRKYKEGEIV